MWWLIVGDVVTHWLKMWWLIVGDVGTHWLEMWRLIVGDVVTHWLEKWWLEGSAQDFSSEAEVSGSNQASPTMILGRCRINV